MFENIREDLRTYEGRWAAQGFLGNDCVQVWSLALPCSSYVRTGSFSSFTYHVAFKIAQIVTGIELPCEVELGQNFIIDHFGGIVIHGDTRFGNKCRIRNGVVVGIRHPDETGVPTFGDNVDIGAGAKVLGPVRIGNNVLIGANAVVINDVPDNSIAVGIPAIVKPLGARKRVSHR